MKSILDFVGDPHEKLKIVHIAGTSGKTSTSYYIANLLADTSIKVGLTVSPHVYSITERVQILNDNFTDEIFLKNLRIF
jgi:dihydrofolate synthase / folylpolyglutamate synthase